MTSLSGAKVRKNRQSNSKIDTKCVFLAKFFGFFLCNLVFRAKFATENKKQTRHGVFRETLTNQKNDRI